MHNKTEGGSGLLVLILTFGVFGILNTPDRRYFSGLGAGGGMDGDDFCSGDCRVRSDHAHAFFTV